MKIDKKSYKLDNNNYSQVFYPKNKIILTASYNDEMKHFIGWTKRFNGNNKKTTHFTIATDGRVYQHFNENYKSNFMGDLILDEESVIIMIENYGWLINDYDNDRFITINGSIYNKDLGVIEKVWRGNTTWAKFNDKQLKSCVDLVDYLVNKLGIDKNIPNDNLTIPELDEYSGILYRSNISHPYTDISPAWEFSKFKELLTNKWKT
jgi:hypothetical protein